jgi:CRISPR/Cas system-associated exonuclease Cas4 (RecB family)
MKEFRIRCSSLSSIMADPVAYPRSQMSEIELEALKTTSAKRSPEQVLMLDDVMARSLSEGAKTHVHNLVRRHIYDYKEPELGSKEIRKGNAMEGSAINLLSSVTGDILTKNERTFDDGYLRGTPDTWDGAKLYDTKVPFTIESFPIVASAAVKMAKAAGYEWQARGYMMLMNEAGIPIEESAIAYMLMETPSDLIAPWDDPEIHDIPLELPPEKRVTLAHFDRDLEIEARIKKKCKAAHAYALRLIEMFEREKAQ